MTRPDRIPHSCGNPACGRTVTGRKFCDGRCRSTYNNGKREYTAIKQQGLPLIAPKETDARSWAERQRDILSRRDPKTKSYR